MRWKGSLVERATETRALEAAARRAATDGGVVLVEGPAGMGKSRLLEVARQQGAGFAVLTASGGALEGDIAFGVVRQLFEPPLAQASADERGELLAGAAAPAGDVFGVVSPDGGSTSIGDLARALHGLFWFVANLAERRPVLLSVDDIHWADGASLQFLAYLARRIEGLPVLVVAAARDGEPRAHETVIAELASCATVLRPAPLTVSGVEAVVREALGASASAELVGACRDATGGNPFYLGELLTAITPPDGHAGGIAIDMVRATVPATVAHSILLRLGRLPDPAPRVARAAALLGDGALLKLAAALAGVELSDADEAADALVRASILADVHPLRFEHPIVRTAVATDIPPAERAATHKRAASLLRDEGAPVERIVPHLLQAPPAGDAWVVDTLRQAAWEATGRGVPDQAVRYLRRALDESPATEDVALLIERTAVELLAGDYASMAASAQRAIALTSDPAMRARIRLLEAYALVSIQGAAAALECVDRACVDASVADPQVALLVEAELAVFALINEQPHPVVRDVARHQHLTASTHAERTMLAAVALDAVRLGEPAEVIRDLAVRAWSDGRLLTEENTHPIGYYTAVLAMLAADAHDEARAAVDAGMVDCLARGSKFGYAGICWLKGLLALARGDLVAAEAEERDCAEHAVPTMVGIGVASLALVLLEQGDVAGAHAALERAGLLSDDRPLYVWGPYVRGLVRLARGQPADALADLEDVGRHATVIGGLTPCLPWGAHVALAHHALGDQRSAERVAREELERATAIGAPRLVGAALRAAGLVASGTEQLGLLTEAVEVLAPTPARLDLAKARGSLGIAMLRAGRRREGREVLELSHDGARECGARGLAETTHEELRVAGARPRRLTFSGVDALTASERRVAEMAAGGLTNRDIAQALFVTPKTVENQLGHAYRKLGVTSRRALADVLASEHDRSGSTPV